MRGVAEGFDDPELVVVTRFLLELSEALEPS